MFGVRPSAADTAAARRRLTCQHCGRQYRSASALAHHRVLHLGQTQCHLCGKVLSRRYELINHLRKVHHAPQEAPQVQRRVPHQYASGAAQQWGADGTATAQPQLAFQTPPPQLPPPPPPSSSS
ncbi:Zinc finger protein 445 [Amphibalanus amphitrite]|uniref:Zinc finger protein 445 n=1 Tax=Amphibalanus amphitrite TaxID=1232801 RepID=A0A6A4VHM8_AMPAM|nr:Zinc finger protein 445 [Amphibalanus amphitrite]